MTGCNNGCRCLRPLISKRRLMLIKIILILLIIYLTYRLVRVFLQYRRILEESRKRQQTPPRADCPPLGRRKDIEDADYREVDENQRKSGNSP